MTNDNQEMHIQTIVPFLWFDENAEEAVNFYISIFKNSSIEGTTRYGDAGPRPKGMVMTIDFRLEGQRFIALNGGPEYQFHSCDFILRKLQDAAGSR